MQDVFRIIINDIPVLVPDFPDYKGLATKNFCHVIIFNNNGISIATFYFILNQFFIFINRI